ncbi:hypothetical protein AVEN_169021-1 [Araneus ventricosus]|uniref:Uncharacterized protein n=1 Tax=Araneus ventricosus TaxID=182803 RepID=A0A4Y2S6N9_ARAVE|nr:hypothetical protein AVEN_169021-1 [Araneus ventricosus]
MNDRATATEKWELSCHLMSITPPARPHRRYAPSSKGGQHSHTSVIIPSGAARTHLFIRRLLVHELVLQPMGDFSTVTTKRNPALSCHLGK